MFFLCRDGRPSCVGTQDSPEEEGEGEGGGGGEETGEREAGKNGESELYLPLI